MEMSNTMDDKEGQSCLYTSKLVTETVGGEVLFRLGLGGE